MNTFERVSSANMDDSSELRENCIYWLQGDKNVTVNFFSGNRFASKVRKLSEQYPDDVTINSENDGIMVATLPLKAVKIGIKEMNYTDEERKAIGERLKNMRS